MDRGLFFNKSIYRSFKGTSSNSVLLFLKNSIVNNFNQDTLFYFLFILFIWYAVSPGYLERRFFVNEIFSLFGFLIFLSNPVILKKNDSIYNNVILIIFIFSFYAVLSFLSHDNLYGYIRHLTIIYSIFSFFLGIKFFSVLLRVNKKDFLFLSPPIATALFSIMSFYRTRQ